MLKFILILLVFLVVLFISLSAVVAAIFTAIEIAYVLCHDELISFLESNKVIIKERDKERIDKFRDEARNLITLTANRTKDTEYVDSILDNINVEDSVD